MSSPTTTSSSSAAHDLPVSILTITIILSVTVILSVFLCLVLRHINRRRSSSSSSPASDGRVAPENPSLPIFTYGSIKRRTSNSGDCAVCLSRFEITDRLRLLPLCSHAFHVECIDTWLRSNRTCPLCRSSVDAAADEDSHLLASRSFRLEIGSVSRRDPGQTDDNLGSYSIGSFDYVVDEESEVVVQDNKEMSAEEGDVASGRSWLMDYVDRMSRSVSTRTMSFRGSGRFFAGSSRRSEMVVVGNYDMEACRVGEEISEMFRWFSGV